MIYLNNAATSYPKPESVIKAFSRSIELPPAGQYRSSTKDTADISDRCRNRLGELAGISETDRIFFTSGSTESLNTAIGGLSIPAEKIITTVTEHNSVLRPLYNLPGIAGDPVLLACDEDGLVPPELFEAEARKGKAGAVVLNHCSNVTGAVQDVKAFGELAEKYGLIFILDASQSLGCMPVKTDEWGVGILCFTGHKSLLGPQGSGGFYVRKGIDLKPLKYGGTGRDSRRLKYGSDYEYEAGTGNMAARAALLAAVEWILEKGLKNIQKQERELSERALFLLSELKGIRVFGRNLKEKGPVLSFCCDKFSPSDISYILQNSYDIVTRAGLMCSPFIHSFIGSGEKGTVRLGFSPFNSNKDIDAVCDALKEII